MRAFEIVLRHAGRIVDRVRNAVPWFDVSVRLAHGVRTYAIRAVGTVVLCAIGTELLTAEVMEVHLPETPAPNGLEQRPNMVLNPTVNTNTSGNPYTGRIGGGDRYIDMT